MKAVISNKIYMSVEPVYREQLETSLTYKIPRPMPNLYPLTIKTYSNVNDSIIAIPRERADLIPDNYTIVDKRIEAPVDFPQPDFTLRPSQQEVYDKLEGSCLIQARPAWGKTFTALALARKLRQKTLIIVHTKMLMNQWIKEIEKVYGVEPGQIGAGKFSVKSPFTVGIINTINNNVPKLADKFGTVIVDECHHCPANIFLKTLIRFKNKYTIGLSATPKRKDGKHVLLSDFFSNTRFVPPDENRMTPKVKIISMPFKIPGTGSEPWQTRLNRLYDDPDYQQMLASISHIFTRKGHTVLSVTNRINLLDRLKELTDEIEPDCSEVIHSNTSDEEREEILHKLRNSQISLLYGGIGCFNEGISEAEISCLILGCPTNNEHMLDQLTGRILRVKEGKLQPVIVDLKFKGKTGNNQLKTRMGFYIQQGWQVEEVQI